MIMYECLIGRPAFTGPTPIAVALKQMQERPTPPRALRPDIPPVLEVGVMRCLEKDPARRFPSADALAAALAPAPASAAPAAPRVNKPVVVNRQNQPASTRMPWVLALVVIVVGAIWMMKHNAPTTPELQPVPAQSAIAPVLPERRAPAPPPAATPAPQVGPVATTPFADQPRFGSQEPGRFDRNDPRDALPDRAADLERARAAAEAGDAAAQMRLSQMLLNGPMEIRDEYQAREWMRRAAEQGLPEAQFAVAMMYDRGVGGSPDRRTALTWIERAAQSGHEGAQRILARAREHQPGQFPQRPPGSRPSMLPPR
jgi:Sel1 repeat